MDKPQKLILSALILVSVASWVLAQAFEQDMMLGMGDVNAASISIFTSVWTVGMAAMMFPAIVPMVLLYNRLVNSGGTNQLSVSEPPRKTYSAKVMLFLSCYLVVWSLTGIALLLGWSEGMRLLGGSIGQSVHYVFAAVLIISGAYQFTPLKSKCLGYCESPMSFFMRRWSSGTGGAVKMGLYHGLYCLGCCWPYFLLMVALGWMNLFWMALFAALIFGEKIWSRGIWIARIAGVGFVVAGALVGFGTVRIEPMMVMESGEMDGMPMDETAMDEMPKDEASMGDTPMNTMLVLMSRTAPVKWDVLA